MIELPTSLFDAAGVRALDRAAIRDHVTGYELMSRAGRAAFDVMRARWPGARRILVVCGSGNNGGDGYVVAALAVRHGWSATVVELAEPRSEESKRARDDAVSAGAEFSQLEKVDLAACDVLVDGVLGTGLSSAPRGTAAQAIDGINESGAPVLALDVPSGLVADTGDAPGAVVRADATCTFIGLKLGLVTGVGPEVAGDLSFHDLDVSDSVHGAAASIAQRIDAPRVRQMLPRRPRCAHKGTFGHVLLLGGNDGMTGALRIASEAAARCGAGLVTAATRGRNALAISLGRPEIMVSAVDDDKALEPLFEGRRSLAVGPGLGRDDWAAAVFECAIGAPLPKVIDADALNLLAGSERRDPNWVLTPHPGEAARLLGCSTRDIARDRPGAARAIVERHGGVCVLKGCGTLVTDGSALYVCDRGNPGMASGGMGDCLTGVIASLLGQGLPLLDAAVCGVWLHARAADLEAEAGGMVGILATDLFPWLRRLMASLDD